MPEYFQSGQLTTDIREVSTSETWDSDEDWGNATQMDRIEIVDGSVQLAEIEELQEWYVAQWGDFEWEEDMFLTLADPEPPAESTDDNIEFSWGDEGEIDDFTGGSVDELPADVESAIVIQTMGESTSGDWFGPVYTQDLTAETHLSFEHRQERNESEGREIRVTVDGDVIMEQDLELSSDWTEESFDVSAYDGETQIAFEMRDISATSTDDQHYLHTLMELE